MNGPELRDLLPGALARLAGSGDELRDLDAAIGDGDLGITVDPTKSYAAAKSSISKAFDRHQDVGRRTGLACLRPAAAAIAAAEVGRDRVTPLRSRVGRASWSGERTEGTIDPGCAMFVLLLKTIAVAP